MAHPKVDGVDYWKAFIDTFNKDMIAFKKIHRLLKHHKKDSVTWECYRLASESFLRLDAILQTSSGASKEKESKGK